MNPNANFTKAFLAICLPLMLFAQGVSALSVCLYARAGNGPASGHSFVNLIEGGKVVESYGFWPTGKYKGSLAINNVSDLPLHILKAKKNVELSQQILDMGEGRICQNARLSRAKIRETVNSYIQNFGRYSLFNNNCTHFAIRIYDAATGDNFTPVQTPNKALKIINSIVQSGAPSYSAYAGQAN